MKDREPIVQVNKDGSKTYVPRDFYEASVQFGDKTARLLALIGLVGGLAGIGGATYMGLESRKVKQMLEENTDPDLIRQVEELERDLSANYAGDCLNENVLRLLVQFGPTDYYACRNSREEMLENALRKTPVPSVTPGPTRTPTPAPIEGGQG